MVLLTFASRRAVATTRCAVRPLRTAFTAPLLVAGSDLSSATRFFSTSPGPGKDEPPHKPLTPFQKLQKWMQPFVTGSKALFAENKQAWAIRSRLKQTPPPPLTRQEMMILRQAHRDLAKSMPLLLFFAVPLVGYAAPLVGYQFPKQLLPWQFWRPDQKTQFFREDAQARAHFYPELVQLLEQIDKKDRALAELLATHKREHDDGSAATARAGLNPAQVGELAPFFDPATNGPAALPALTSHHVHVLARSIALVPAFSWVWQLLPRATVETFLNRRMDELRVDDAMLLREGIDALSLSELEFACEERGIVDGYGDREALRAQLREWLAMYDSAAGTDQSPAHFPSALLLHAPALLNPTGRAQHP